MILTSSSCVSLQFNSKMQTEVVNKEFTEVQSALVLKKKTENKNKKSSIQVNINFL